MISSTDAFLVLRKWQEDLQPMELMLAGDGFRMTFRGRIIGLEETKLEFLHDEPDKGAAWLDLADCRFAYEDSREVPAGSVSDLKFCSILTVIRADGTMFMFAEVPE